MKLKVLSASILAGVMSMACNPGKYEKSEHGITVNVTPTGENSVIKVRLQVMDDKIIRVSATPDKKFAPDNSLVTVPQKRTQNILSRKLTRPSLSSLLRLQPQCHFQPAMLNFMTETAS